MPHVKSLWPELPPLPDRLNVYETIIGQPQHDEWPDFTVHLEEETGKSRTFKELKKCINYLASALAGPVVDEGLGLQPGAREVIGIMGDNSSDYVVLVLALMKIGIPFVSISCYSTPYELKHYFALSKPTRLFVAPQYLDKALQAAQGTSISSNFVYILNASMDGYTSLEGLITRAQMNKFTETRVRIVQKDAPLYLLFSSGTTGLPKVVIVTHGNILWAFQQGISIIQHRMAVEKPPPPPTPDGLPVTLAFLPMYHTFGLHINCIRSFITPTRIVFLPRWDPTKALRAIAKHKVTFLSMVPSMYHQIVNHPEFDKTDLSSILNVHNGAAHLPRQLLDKFLSRTPNNPFFSDGYGMSEVSAMAILKAFPGSLDGRIKDVPDALGVLLPGMEARIVREDGSEAAFNEVGELWLKGHNVVSGYLDNEPETRMTFVDGWLRTGDHFRVDENHNFYFADRIKDVLKVSGSQVSPVELETVLLSHPEKLVSDVSVAGVNGSGNKAGEKVPRAWVVLSENGKSLGAAAAVHALERWHQDQLSKYKWLRGGIEVVVELPKSPIGKTLRRVLQDEYEQRLRRRAML